MNQLFDVRTIYLLLFFCLLFSGQSSAQDNGFHYGARFGLGESNLQIQNTPDVTSKLVLSGGIGTVYQSENVLGLSIDLLFTSKGAQSKGIVTETDVLGVQHAYTYHEKYNLLYAEIPVMGRLSLPLSSDFFLNFFAGPGINFKLAGLQTRQFDDGDYNNTHGYSNKDMKDLNTIEYSLIYGAGISVKAPDRELFFIDFRSNNALSPVGYINGHLSNSSYFLISVGYMF